ncbi:MULTISPECIES: Mu transposase C-terminal domain-containing protein [unclassified Ectothiorhodospira]|uniref:Mu transposase C-terminal domain-containing protein n=1 Tax=unclassified Ectothiorhodospira TaxID=2684909 RepID=UPI001EE908DC|nr:MULTISPECIES: Mu transposase C-terminal domain-containing protein [unclassified Ectothiorhodospira]MCG5514755.1 Mu transposase C-terminal domain-containing protein [Ectothiorhodospira sp. 9100]MCG5518354.1 Mu transposase C-terminal domain-containing protein [Ectothiorhodospira sp. 9905]
MSEPAFLSMKPGSFVISEGKRFKITHMLGVDSVLAKNLETNAVERLRVDLIRPFKEEDLPDGVVAAGRDIEDICDEDWKEAQRRFAVIKPLLDDPGRTREKVRLAAEVEGVATGTLYDWIRAYNESGQLSALVPQKRGRKPGQTGLDSDIEEIIEAAIQEIYLSKQRQKPQDVVDHVALLCRNAGIKPPHANTVRNRLKRLRPTRVLRARGMGDKARNLFTPIRGNFPGAEFPLAVVQIDHTEADIIVVEEGTRQPMGRPTITLAIDVYSRMVTGCYVSMEKPSAVAAGMCLARSMMPKNEYLADLEVPGDWPVWGKIGTVHCDNAKEFRGAMLSNACEQYGIDLQMRPVKVPHYGGHIERLMGTSAGEFRKLPGATFSCPKERKGYDSEKESALTLREFEQRLVDFIVNVYHQRVHADLNVPPRRQWEIGLLGDTSQPGKGIPEVPSDPRRLRLDFLPFVERTVQPYGIVVDEIFYYHEVLTPWINAREPKRSKEKRKFIVRRDPRDISVVYFFDPEAHQYYEIPYRNTAHPPISVWELRAAQQRLKEEGRAHVDEDTIFEAISRMRERVEEAVTKTKAARRQQHRIKTTQKSAQARQKTADTSAPAEEPLPAGGNAPTAAPADADDIFSMPIQPFDDLAVKQ